MQAAGTVGNRHAELDRSKSNLAAIEDACQAFRRRLMAELTGNPVMHGSVSVKAQLNGGIVDRFLVTADESVKCGMTG